MTTSPTTAPALPTPVLALSLLGLAAVAVDAVAGQARLVLAGLVLMALALAVAVSHVLRAGVGRPGRTSRLAARTAVGASLLVAAFLASVGVLERTSPEATESLAFAAGVSLMSVLLLVVLPLALAVLGWCTWRDRRLPTPVRLLPWALLLVVLAAAAASLATDGTQERWLQVAAVAAGGAVLTGLSAGVAARRAPEVIVPATR